MMMKSLTTTAALALALPAFAQDGGLSSEDARSFLEGIQPKAEQAVAEGNWQGVQDWMSRHVSDDAPIYIRGNFLLSNGPAMTFTGSMKGADLQKFVSMGMAGPHGNMLDMVEDYTLETRIMDTWQLPGGKVSAAVAFYEYGAFKGGDKMPFAGPYSAETVCALRMGGNADEIQIELANCETNSNI
jgi:hypothetical protein